MKNFSFEDIGAVTATFATGEGVKGGQVVKVTGNGTVGPCEDGDAFCGVALEPRKGGCGVQVKGFAAVPATGTLALGWTGLVADGKGGVRAAKGASVDGQTSTPAETGVPALVVSAESGSAVICL